ncbi:hypothetical protein [Pseudomonas fluorescens]|uniref:Type III secretion effector protein n=1 Tax=Pseudomonas fluorescens TaxID=294 RepID=A0A2N1DWP7_PSEFL|nr:hypothetical protein [Pseudomonas fluorescens]PKH14532.1 hypothetical protein CIB54_24035 [Pseudomonas fluorescens]
MWSSGVFGPGVANAGFGRQQVRGESTPVTPGAEVIAAKQLLSDMFDAQQTGKTQAVQDARDKLNALREQLGDEKFKEVLNGLIDDADDKYLEFLRRLLKELYPDEDVTPPAPSPTPPRGGGGGGGGGGVSPGGFGPSESMSNKPITEGSKHFHYTPDKSNPGKKPENIWSGFSQGPDGNCITVSAIKASMMQFGQKPTDVFKDVKETSKGYNVTMRDGFKLSLTKDELMQAATHARFQGDDPAMMTDANFMYAASAKRAQMENNDGTAGRSFQAAMDSLNDGESPREGLDRLGLKGHYRPATDTDLRSSKVGTVEYGGHSMAVLNGRIELWGKRGGVPQSGIATVLF